jgi:hypothetical protein
MAPKKIILKKTKSKLFWNLTEEVTTNLGYKYSELLNMFKYILYFNESLIKTTCDSNHGQSFGYICQLSNGMKFCDSFVNKKGRVDPRTTGRIKLLCKELLKEPKFLNPFLR